MDMVGHCAPVPFFTETHIPYHNFRFFLWASVLEFVASSSLSSSLLEALFFGASTVPMMTSPPKGLVVSMDDDEIGSVETSGRVIAIDGNNTPLGSFT